MANIKNTNSSSGYIIVETLTNSNVFRRACQKSFYSLTGNGWWNNQIKFCVWPCNKIYAISVRRYLWSSCEDKYVNPYKKSIKTNILIGSC